MMTPHANTKLLKIFRNNLCNFKKPLNLRGNDNNLYNLAFQRLNFATMSQTDKPKLVAVEESHRFMIDCFKAVKVPQENAEAMADLLVAADYRGHQSHGMNRLEMYINDLIKNATNGAVKPKILKETPATAWIDGQNGLGAVVGNYCMDLAIKKLRKLVLVGYVQKDQIIMVWLDGIHYVQ